MAKKPTLNQLKNDLVSIVSCVHPEDFKSGEYSTVKHDLISYGISAVAHTFLMKKARDDLIAGKISLEDFTKKYELNFKESPANLEYNISTGQFSEEDSKLFAQFSFGFVGTLRSLEKEGLFVPKEAHPYACCRRFQSRQDAEIHYFSPDYGNCLSTVKGNDDYNFMHRKFVPEDLTNIKIVLRGVKFASDVWQKYCVGNFEETQDYLMKCKELNKEKTAQATEVGRKFIAFYSEWLD